MWGNYEGRGAGDDDDDDDDNWGDSRDAVP
jgi:hypothetical protein